VSSMFSTSQASIHSRPRGHSIIARGRSAESFHIGNVVPIWESCRTWETRKLRGWRLTLSCAITNRNLQSGEPLASRVLIHCLANCTPLLNGRNRRATPRSTIHTRDPHIRMDLLTKTISGGYSRRLHLRSVSVSQAPGPCERGDYHYDANANPTVRP
jgi:hypothetical protein